MLRALTLTLALAFGGGAYASSDLVSELKDLARANGGTPSAELQALTYDDAVYLLDGLNHTDLRRIAEAMNSGTLDLPRGVRHAIELKAPRLNARGPGR